jgi:hypothetical protein
MVVIITTALSDAREKITLVQYGQDPCVQEMRLNGGHRGFGLRMAIAIDVFAADVHVSVEFAPEFRLCMDEGVRGHCSQ